MKRLNTTTKVVMGILALISICFLACSKDFEDVILDDFDFNFEIEYPDGGFVFEKSRTTFTLVPTKEISTVDYFMRFSTEEKMGYFLSMEGDTISERDTLHVNERIWTYNYVAIDTGAHNIKFTAWDSNDRTKELEFFYKAEFASFSFLLNKGVDEFIINSKNPVNITLIRDKESEGPESKGNFEISYQIENGTGKLHLGDSIYDAGKPFELPKGISELKYLPENLGEHKLTVTAKAPDGAVLTQELNLTVLDLNFSINATAASTKVELDTNLAIAIDLRTEDEKSNVTYEISHAFASSSEGGGTIRDHNGGVMEPGQYRAIIPDTYNYTFTSTELGKRKIYFDLRDSNGQIKKDSVEVEVANIPFTFTGNSESNIVFKEEKTQLNFNLKSNGNTENIEYFLTYEILEGNGRITNANDRTLQNSTEYTVELGNFNFFYYPESVGSHQILFSLVDNYGQVVEPVVIDIETKLNDFTVTLTPSKTTEYVNIPVNMIIDIDETPEGADDIYEAFYSSVGNSSLRVNGTEYGPGDKFQLRPNTNNVVYTGSEAGQHDIVLSVESSADVNHTANVSIGYDQVDFSFTGGSEKTNISVDEIISLNFNISQSVGSSNYSMRFTSNGNARIKNENGTIVSAGNIYDVSRGNFNWSLEGTDEADVALTFYVLNDTGLEKTVTLMIGVSEKNYNFTAAASRAQAETGEAVPVNFNITEQGIGGDSYVMYFSSGNSNGTFEYNDNIYSAGQSFTVPVGSFQGRYIGSSTSGHSVEFTTRSSSGVEKNTTVGIEVTSKDYNFTAIATQSQADTGEPVEINFNINELGLGGDSYEMSYSSGSSNGVFQYQGTTYVAGETFSVIVGSFQGSYTGLSSSNHEINFTVRSSSEIEKINTVSIEITPKDYEFTANATSSQANTGESVDINFNLLELGAGGDSYTMVYSSGGSNGTFEFQGRIYTPGEQFNVPVGSFFGNYTGISESNHNVEFSVRSTSQVEKSSNIIIRYDRYEELFNLITSPSFVDKEEGRPFPIGLVTDAPGGHDSSVTYELAFSFRDNRAGYVLYDNIIYNEGELIPIVYGSTSLEFVATTEESFTMDFRVENSTGISQTVSETITILKKPKVAAKGEKYNIDCGGLNGCDYTVRISTCFDVNCSEAYNGASLQQVEIRIYNRQSGKWDTRLFNYDDAQGSGVNRYFELEEEPSEGRLKYLDQPYEVRVKDTNNQWSEVTTGNIIRV